MNFLNIPVWKKIRQNAMVLAQQDYPAGIPKEEMATLKKIQKALNWSDNRTYLHCLDLSQIDGKVPLLEDCNVVFFGEKCKNKLQPHYSNAVFIPLITHMHQNPAIKKQAWQQLVKLKQ